MIRPRNTLVLVKLVQKPEQKVGKIALPNSQSGLFAEGEIMAIGPGSVSATGGRPETFDLAVGQRVLIQHKQRRGPHQTADCGMEWVEAGQIYHLFEQTNILGIIADAGSAPAVDAPAPVDKLDLKLSGGCAPKGPIIVS